MEFSIYVLKGSFTPTLFERIQVLMESKRTMKKIVTPKSKMAKRFTFSNVAKISLLPIKENKRTITPNPRKMAQIKRAFTFIPLSQKFQSDHRSVFYHLNFYIVTRVRFLGNKAVSVDCCTKFVYKKLF